MNCARVFSENLRCHRKRQGLSQEALGFQAELHRTEISLLERGARVPRIDTLLKIAVVLNVEPAELLVGIVWRPGTMSPGHFEDG